MKLLGSLRGDGMVVWDAGEAPVTYQVDMFETGKNHRNGSGVLDGNMVPLARLQKRTVKLRLEDGAEIDIALLQIDRHGGTFETRGPLPDRV